MFTFISLNNLPRADSVLLGSLVITLEENPNFLSFFFFFGSPLVAACPLTLTLIPHPPPYKPYESAFVPIDTPHGQWLMSDVNSILQ